MEHKINVIDLFAGCGGFSVGFERAGYKITKAVEFDKNIAASYSHNHKGTLMFAEDIGKIADTDHFSNKEADVIIGGPPCQGFSMAGKRDIFDVRNSLFHEVIRIVSVVQPKVVVIENVVGLLSMVSELAKKNIAKYQTPYLDSHISEYPLIAYEVRASRCSFRNDGISPCLTAKMGTGGNNVPIVVSQGRKLTERECLRIMGFPEWYKIAKNSSHSYKQLGNSVVVPVVSKLAKEIINVLSKITLQRSR